MKGQSQRSFCVSHREAPVLQKHVEPHVLPGLIFRKEV